MPVALHRFFWWKALEQSVADAGTEKPPRLGPFELLAHVSQQDLKRLAALGADSRLSQHGMSGEERNAGCEGSRR